MARDDSTPKNRRRVQRRPRIDAIIRHIATGAYDDELGKLRRAIEDRNELRKAAVDALVSEVYGEDYRVLPKDAKPNPFLPNELLRDQPKRTHPNQIFPGESPHLRSPAEADDDPIGPDYESRSPVIGSIE